MDLSPLHTLEKTKALEPKVISVGDNTKIEFIRGFRNTSKRLQAAPYLILMSATRVAFYISGFGHRSIAICQLNFKEGYEGCLL